MVMEKLAFSKSPISWWNNSQHSFSYIKTRRHLIKFNRLSFFLFSFFDCDKKKNKGKRRNKKEELDSHILSIDSLTIRAETLM